MSAVEKIRLQYPLPIAKLYESVRLESEARQRVRKLVDLFERTDPTYLTADPNTNIAGRFAGRQRNVYSRQRRGGRGGQAEGGAGKVV